MKNVIYVVIVLIILIVCFGCATTPKMLMQSAESGDYAEVKRLIEEGADVNAKDNNGWTALMIASEAGKEEIANWLIEAGADVSAQDNDGFTAFMIALFSGHREMTQLLLPVGFQYGNDQALIHIYSGAVFEQTIGDWQIFNVTKYDDIGKDVSVSYSDMGESYYITASIYVYPTKAGVTSADLLRSHYQQVKNDVFTVYKNVQLVLEQENMFDFPSGDRFGIWAIFNLEMNNEESMSFLFLFGENEWFILHRISYTATVHGNKDVSNAIANIVSSLDYSTIN